MAFKIKTSKRTEDIISRLELSHNLPCYTLVKLAMALSLRSEKPLEESDFIVRYNPYGTKKNVEKYKLIDNFCLFWQKYVEPSQKEADFMTDNITSDIMKVWKGVAFEEVCWQHVAQIKRALEIGGVKSTTSIWNVRGDDNKDGVQIDLIIKRNDNIVNLCEMKFASAEYSISKEEDLKLRKRINMLKETLLKRQSVHLTMITSYGINYGKYSGIVQKSLTIDDLFD